MAELIEFRVPTEGDKTLVVWNLSSGPKAEDLHHALFTEFSKFGLLYSVPVFPNAAVAAPGFYAIIKFYSARDAHRAQKSCHQKQLFQTSPVKVHLGTKHKAVQHQARLNNSRCQELANDYFGFNGRSKTIIKLQDVSDLEESENQDKTAAWKPSLKFLCAVEVVLPADGCRSPGGGIAVEPVDKQEEGVLTGQQEPDEEQNDNVPARGKREARSVHTGKTEEEQSSGTPMPPHTGGPADANSPGLSFTLPLLGRPRDLPPRLPLPPRPRPATTSACPAPPDNGWIQEGFKLWPLGRTSTYLDTRTLQRPGREDRRLQIYYNVPLTKQNRGTTLRGSAQSPTDTLQ
ncbi:LOW QUALITY PROTEIN: RAD52 motif-containing protein 1-like [Rhynchocyon petersi]